MAITIKGIRVNSVSIQHSVETGRVTIESANYSLISSTDHVLATQSIGSYSGQVKIEPSLATAKLLEEFMWSYRQDVVTTLGLETA